MSGLSTSVLPTYEFPPFMVGRAVVLSYPEQFRVLKDICAEQNIPYQLMSHPSTLTAREKQDVLPPLIAVQKSITVRLADRYFLVSGLGNFTLTTSVMRQIAQCLHLSRSGWKNATINPSGLYELPPEDLCGLRAGMVSPFFPPYSSVRFSGVFCLQGEDSSYSAALCAISLSLESSLVLFSSDLSSLISLYAQRVYPTIPLFFLSDRAD